MLQKMPHLVKTQTCSKENLSGCVGNQKQELQNQNRE